MPNYIKCKNIIANSRDNSGLKITREIIQFFICEHKISQVFVMKWICDRFWSIIHFLLQIPFLIVQLIQATVSLKRLNDFLNADEIDKTAIGKEVDDKSNAIEAKNATFMWDANHHIPTLSNLSFSVKKGSCIGQNRH